MPCRCKFDSCLSNAKSTRVLLLPGCAKGSEKLATKYDADYSDHDTSLKCIMQHPGFAQYVWMCGCYVWHTDSMPLTTHRMLTIRNLSPNFSYLNFHFILVQLLITVLFSCIADVSNTHPSGSLSDGSGGVEAAKSVYVYFAKFAFYIHHKLLEIALFTSIHL